MDLINFPILFLKSTELLYVHLNFSSLVPRVTRTRRVSNSLKETALPPPTRLNICSDRRTGTLSPSTSDINTCRTEWESHILPGKMSHLFGNITVGTRAPPKCILESSFFWFRHPFDCFIVRDGEMFRLLPPHYEILKYLICGLLFFLKWFRPSEMIDNI